MSNEYEFDFHDNEAIDQRVARDKDVFRNEILSKPLCTKARKVKDRLLLLEIESATDYIRYIEQIGESAENCPPFIYRGHSRIHYPLEPSIMRKPLYAGVSRTKAVIDDYEKMLMDEWRKRARAYVSIPARESRRPWECLARAQHHYLPTRLLDWTERPSTALFFAVEMEKRNNEFSCVWSIMAPDVVKPDNYKAPKNIEKVYLYRPPHIVPRIAMQQSCFTIHPSNYLEIEHTWIKGLVVVFVIRKRNRRKILNGLYSLGINRAALFPDLDGIAAYLRDSIKPIV